MSEIQRERSAAAAAMQRVGKFELRRLLGRGAQSAVHLGFDPQLQREVAIKLLRAGTARESSLLAEARAVSRLRHPNIVPIYEAGEHNGQLYLVFEYIAGRTLEQTIRQDGALAPARAAELMIGVLDAIEQAHKAGVIHRDLKPSNVLIDEHGLPRVMDFGLAAKPGAEVGPGLCGTPAYMAPEYIAQRTVTPQYDLFSAGLMLYEMLLGQPAVQGDVFQALHRVSNLPLDFSAMGEALDPVLHNIVLQAAAKDPALRYADAAQMRAALQAWLNPAAAASARAGEAGKPSTLDFLLRRMRTRSDFPAMSTAINAIQRLASSERADVSQLSNAILKDFALTNKILRLVNSAFYAVRGSERIRTVSRAIVMLGFDAVRGIAISLTLFEHIRDKTHAAALKEEFLRSNLTGILARELGPRLDLPGEEAFLCALFHNLGRLLAHSYFWEEAESIAKLVRQEGGDEQQASLRVLGMSYQDLGIGVAQSWGFPEPMIDSMRHLPPGKPARPESPEQRLRLLSSFADEACTVIEAGDAAARGTELQRLAQRYGDCLPLSAQELSATVDRSLQRIGELATTLRIDLRQTRLGSGLAGVAPAKAEPAGIAPRALASAASGAMPGTSGAAESLDGFDAQAVLAAGIQDISQALIEDFSLPDLLGIVAETIYRALGAQRVLICLREPRGGPMRARFGFGAQVPACLPRFQFALGGNDLFNLILARDADVLIRDAGEAKIRNHLPAWHREHFAAGSFLILPIGLKGAPVAMIYADHERPDALQPSECELSLLHTLRNQALLAIKQSR